MTRFLKGRAVILIVSGLMALTGLLMATPRFRSTLYVWQGDFLRRSGDLGEAATAYDHAIRAHPSPSAMVKLGDVLDKTHHGEQSIAILRRAVRMYPHDATAQYKLGEGLLRIGDVPSARKHLRQAVQIDQGQALAHLALSDVAQRQGDTLGANQEMELAVENGADTPAAHVKMGEIYLGRGDSRAGQEFRKALEDDPDSPEAHLRLGLLTMDGDPAGAERHFKAAMDGALFDPGDKVRTLCGLALVACRSNNPSAATEYLRQAEDIQPDPTLHGLISYAQGVVRHYNDDARGSAISLRDAAAFAPREPMFQQGALLGRLKLYGDALTAVRDGHAPEAESDLKELSSLAPDDTQCHLELGNLLLCRHDMDAATREFQAAIGLAPRDPEAWLRLSVALFRQGKAAESGSAISRALQIEPEWPKIRPDVDVLLGRIYLACNQPSRAEAYLQLAAASHSPLVNADECVSLLRQADEGAQHSALASVTAKDLSPLTSLPATNQPHAAVSGSQKRFPGANRPSEALPHEPSAGHSLPTPLGDMYAPPAGLKLSHGSRL